MTAYDTFPPRIQRAVDRARLDLTEYSGRDADAGRQAVIAAAESSARWHQTRATRLQTRCPKKGGWLDDSLAACYATHPGLRRVVEWLAHHPEDPAAPVA